MHFACVFINWVGHGVILGEDVSMPRPHIHVCLAWLAHAWFVPDWKETAPHQDIITLPCLTSLFTSQIVSWPVLWEWCVMYENVVFTCPVGCAFSDLCLNLVYAFQLVYDHKWTFCSSSTWSLKCFASISAHQLGCAQLGGGLGARVWRNYTTWFSCPNWGSIWSSRLSRQPPSIACSGQGECTICVYLL